MACSHAWQVGIVGLGRDRSMVEADAQPEGYGVATRCVSSYRGLLVQARLQNAM